MKMRMASILGILADATRDTFISQMRRRRQDRRGGLPAFYAPPWVVTPFGRRLSSSLENGLDPRTFVNAQVVPCARPPHPAKLLTPEALKRCRRELTKKAPSLKCELTVAYGIQLQKASTEVGCRMAVSGMSELDAWVYVLWDTHIGMQRPFSLLRGGPTHHILWTAKAISAAACCLPFLRRTSVFRRSGPLPGDLDGFHSDLVLSAGPPLGASRDRCAA